MLRIGPSQVNDLAKDSTVLNSMSTRIAHRRRQDAAVKTARAGLSARESLIALISLLILVLVVATRGVMV